MSLSPVRLLALVSALAVSAAAEGAGPRRVLVLSDSPSDDAWLAELEAGLNEGAEPFAVIRRAVTGGDDRLLQGLLASYAPAFVVSRQALPAPVRNAIPSSGSARTTAKRILAKAGAGSPRGGSLAALRARARAHLELSSDAGAEAALRGVHALAPDDPDALLELLRLRRLERPWPAIDAAVRLAALPGRSADQRADALLAGAELRARVGDAAAAQRDYESALSLRPRDAEASLGLARVMRESPLEALRHAARAVDAAPGSAEALRVLAEIHRDLDDHAAARESLERALRLAPDDLDSLALMVRAKRGRPEEAAAHADRAQAVAEKAPRWYRPDAYRLCARMRLDLGDRARAALLYKRALAIDPEDLNALQDLARLRLDRPQEPIRLLAGPSGREPSSDDMSEEAIGRALSANPDDLEALSQLLGIRREQGRLLEASALAKRFHEAVPKAPSWMHSSAYRLLAQLAWEIGDPSRAWLAARERDWWALDEVRLRMRPAGGGVEYASAEVRVAEARAELGDEAGAEERLRRVLETFPGDLHALEALLRLKASQRRFSEALAFAERLEKAGAGAPAWRRAAAAVQTAQMRLELGDEAGAEKSLRTALGYFPEDLPALQGLLRLLTSRGRFGEALPYAERLEKAGAQAPAVQRAAACAQKARIELALKDAAGAEKSLARSLALAPEGPALPMMLDLALSQGRYGEALPYAETLEKALSRAPPVERAAAAEKKARILLELKDEAGAEASLKRALAFLPEGPASPMLLNLTMSQRRFAEALPYAESLERAAAQAPPRERAAILAQKARIQLELEDEAGAEKSLAEAHALFPEGPALPMLLHLATTRRRFAEALAWVEKLETAGARTLPRERAALAVRKAQIQLELKDEAGAEKSLGRALRLFPEGPALPMLLELMIAQRRHAEALAYAETLDKNSARAGARERAEVFEKKARVQLELKDEAGAEKSLGRAMSLFPEGPALPLLLELMLSQGRFAEALPYAERLEPSGAPRERAASLARKARIQLELKDEAGAEKSLAESSRLFPEGPALPMLLNLAMTRRRFAEALSLAERLERASPQAPPRERAALLVKTAQIRLELKDEAGAEKSLERALASAPDDMEALWMLFEAKGRSPREALAAVASRRPAEDRGRAVWLALHGHALALNRDDAGALRDISAAVDLDPDGVCFGPLFDRRRSRLDARYFDRCLVRFPSNAALYSDRGVSRYLAGRQDEAMADFRKAVALDPGHLAARMNILSMLSGQGRFAEALAEADAAVAAAKDRESPLFLQIRDLRPSLSSKINKK
ncbi:MAG: tetratricopeptide repeat protein [Elusimicrobia bacterium]|nr:tetratricopeptide repeat protein [Elusimicrobiota bacterium]